MSESEDIVWAVWQSDDFPTDYFRSRASAEATALRYAESMARRVPPSGDEVLVEKSPNGNNYVVPRLGDVVSCTSVIKVKP